MAQYTGKHLCTVSSQVTKKGGLVCNLLWRALFLPGLKRKGYFCAVSSRGMVNADLPEFQIGYDIDQRHEGQGYVTEAMKAVLAFCFESLKAHRVSLECDDTNSRSWQVAENDCGFVKEGHRLENEKHADGSFSGTVYYGLLRSEFEASVRMA